MPPQEYHHHENFYEFDELKNFTNNLTDRTILNITKFIETKTKNEYTVAKRKMIVNLNQHLFENILAIFAIQSFLNEICEKHDENPNTKDLCNSIYKFLGDTWQDVSNKNRSIADKWVKDLKNFKLVKGK